jgi:glycosyltransferase involved in cell wall biosynthesis
MNAWRTPGWWRDGDGPRPIVMLTTSWPTAGDPVAGVFVQTLQRRLEAEGHLVEVIAGPPGPGGLPEQLAAAPIGALARAGRSFGRFVVEGVRAVRRMGPRAHVVGHWLVPGGLAAQTVARSTGVTATTIVHSSAARAVARLPWPLDSQIARASVGRGPWIASCTVVADVVLEAAGPEVLPGRRVMPMPVPPPWRVGTPPLGPPWRVATLGRLVPIKGIDDLLRSVVGRDVEVHVCGDGPSAPALRRLADRLEVRAVFHGTVVGRHKAEVLSSVHALAQPSRVLGDRQEGAPVAVLEAISYGIPVLATDTGGLAQTARAGPHVIAAPGARGLRAAWPRMEALMSEHWSDPVTRCVGISSPVI